MKGITFFLLTAFYATSLFSQLYTVDFESSSTSNTLDSLQVINLTSNDTLLVVITNSSAIANSISDCGRLSIYPNPSYGELFIEPGISSGQNAMLRITDLSGCVMFSEQLNTISNENIHISNIPKGMYVLSLSSPENMYSELIISQSELNSWTNVSTSYTTGTGTANAKAKTAYALKSTTTESTTIALGDSTMPYNTGERLLLTGYSGTMQTVVSFIPADDTIISFNYYACTDGDNNNYKVVEIGDQIWMAENLKTTKYNNGDAIPLVTDNTAWSALSTPGYCYYNNTTSNDTIATYGALYNWYTVETNSLCPTGWHVPTDAEWTTLTDFLGGESVAGGKLKETDTTHWTTPNTGATNETGFTAVPGGCRDGISGSFYGIGDVGYWWSATEASSSDAWGRDMHCGDSGVGRDYGSKELGFSVRCLRD